jgi:peptidyl-prolyl cis-trans isomerase C
MISIRKISGKLLLTQLLAVSFLMTAQADENPAQGQEYTLDQPFATQGGVVLTQAEIDAAFSRIPPQHRLNFIRDGEKVNQLVGSLLRNKIVAADAIAAGYNEDPLASTRMVMAAERELAEAWMTNLLENAPEADYEALAHENYLANPDQFKTEAIIDISHILVSTDGRSQDEALELALSIRQQLLEDPARFEALVDEFSDDPGKSMNHGRYPLMKYGQMVKEFEEAAFSLQTPGELSEPVNTSYGYHIIRLNKAYPTSVKPFEEVREAAVIQAKQKHLVDYRSRYLRNLFSGPIELPDGAVDAMARRHFGEDLELMPDFQE